MDFKKIYNKLKSNRRSLLRIIISIFPTKIRHRFIRNHVRVDANVVNAFEFKIADTVDELEQAFRILHDAYVEQGYMHESKSGLRFLKYFALPSTTTIIAKKDNEVVGTMSIIRRSRMGLPMETIFNLNQLTQLDSEVAEISSLAVGKKYRGQRGEVFLPLCRFLHQYCVQYMKIRYMVIAVHPSMSELYRALFGFQDLKNFFLTKRDSEEYQVKQYSFANGNPAVPLILDLENLYSFLKKAGSQSIMQNSLFTFFFKRQFPSMQFPIRFSELNIDPVLSLKSIQYFLQLTLKDGWFQQLSPEEIDLLNKIYFGRVQQFATAKSMFFRQSRLIYSFKGKLEIHGSSRLTQSLYLNVEVMDISKNGLSLQIIDVPTKEFIFNNESSTYTSRCTFRFWSLANKHMQINAEIVWSRNSRIGLKLNDDNLDWIQFFNIVSFGYGVPNSLDSEINSEKYI